MIFEETNISGTYFMETIGDFGKILTESKNKITNEGLMLLVKSIMTNNFKNIIWKFRVGTGRRISSITDTYNTIMSDTSDSQIIEVGIGSEFYKKEKNIITLNGIVLSNEGFVKTISYDPEDKPQENIVTVQVKTSDIHQRFSNSTGVWGKIQENTITINGKGVPVAGIYAPQKQTKEVNLHVIELGSWLNDIDESKKWNNISLIAIEGTTKYLFSRAVLPPFFKCKGVRTAIKYCLTI